MFVCSEDTTLVFFHLYIYIVGDISFVDGIVVVVFVVVVVVVVVVAAAAAAAVVSRT